MVPSSDVGPMHMPLTGVPPRGHPSQRLTVCTPPAGWLGAARAAAPVPPVARPRGFTTGSHWLGRQYLPSILQMRAVEARRAGLGGAWSPAFLLGPLYPRLQWLKGGVCITPQFFRAQSYVVLVFVHRTYTPASRPGAPEHLSEEGAP